MMTLEEIDKKIAYCKKTIRELVKINNAFSKPGQGDIPALTEMQQELRDLYSLRDSLTKENQDND